MTFLALCHTTNGWSQGFFSAVLLLVVVTTSLSLPRAHVHPASHTVWGGALTHGSYAHPNPLPLRKKKKKRERERESESRDDPYARQKEKKRESSHFGSSRECSRPAAALLPVSFSCSFSFASGGGRSQSGGLSSPAWAVSTAISGYTVFACYLEGVRKGDIVENGPAGDRRPTSSTFGSL